MWPGNRAHLGEHFFPPTTSLGFLGRSLVCWSNNILEVIRNGGRETQHLERCVPGLVSGAQEPNNLEKSEGRNVCEDGKLSL